MGQKSEGGNTQRTTVDLSEAVKYSIIMMRANLQFPLEDWELVLPQDLVDLCSDLEERDLKRWTLVPSKYWPVEIRTIRDKFWLAMKEGKDTKDVSTYLTSMDVATLYTKVATTPSILACVLCIDMSAGDALNSFYQQLLASMEDILRTKDVWHGEPDNKLIASKVKLFSTSKNMSESMTNLMEKAPTLLAQESKQGALPDLGPDDVDEELEGIMSTHEEVENKKEKDFQKNLEQPIEVVEGVMN